MKIELDDNEINTVKNLINTRIQELRYGMDEDAEDNEDEIRGVIREYKKLLEKIDEQTK
ncbi:hypothetical protein [Clostridium hydrogenum]|uniref:hypothetical protein n=1 Tax=Clostridium hydrogenum TaxID=2855764 RepID=UPI001F3B2D28|nr:hypothetical protein [Clostridium hydrogenum]